MNKIINVIEDSLICFGLAIGLNDIESLLGIIILSVQIILICSKCVIKVYRHLKSNSIDKAIDEIEETKKEIEDISSKPKKGGE